MKVCFHSMPLDLLSGKPPFSEDDLCRLVREAASLGFKAFQIGPFYAFPHYDAAKLRRLLDQLGLERNIHIGGIYDAVRFSLGGEEYQRAFAEVLKGIELCRGVGSDLVAFHPPFFIREKDFDMQVASRARKRLQRLVEALLHEASPFRIRLALESFCYSPFIFNGLGDFGRFVDDFSSDMLGMVLEVGHLHQKELNLAEATRLFGGRLFDVHIHDAITQEDFRKATHLPLGKGGINFKAVLNALRGVNYQGWLTLEVRGQTSDVVESKKRLEKIIREIGF